MCDMAKERLTPKQQAFANAYLSGKNASEAYRGAYDCVRMSDASIYREACRLLDNPKISAFIDRARAEVAKEAKWSLEKATERQSLINDKSFNELLNNPLVNKDATPALKAFMESTDRLNRFCGIDKELDGSKNEESTLRPPQFDLSAHIAPTFCEVSRAIEAGVQEVILKGGRGSAKSSYGYQKQLDVFLSRPSAMWLCVRLFANTLRRSCFANVIWAITKRGMSVGVPGSGADFIRTVSPMELTYSATGQKIIFSGLDDPDKIKSITFEDPNKKIEILTFEEYAQFKKPEDIRNVEYSALRSDYGLVFKIFNPPPDAEHWANKEAEAKAQEDGAIVHHSTWRDVPEEFLGNRFIEQAKLMYRISPEAAKNELDGKTLDLTGRVFANVQESTIVWEDIASLKWIRRGIDWGFEGDPFVFLSVGYDRKRSVLYIFDEIANHHTLDKTNVDAAREIMAERSAEGEIQRTGEGEPVFRAKRVSNEVRADCAGAKDIATWRHLGINVKGASKAVPVDDGIRWLQKRRAIIIDRKRCPLAYQEFSRYAANEDDEGRFLGYPDQDNHTIDAVRYAVFDLIADPNII